MQMTQEAAELLRETVGLAMHNGHEYVMPEHLLYLLTYHYLFEKAFEYCGGDGELLRGQVGNFLTQSVEASKALKEAKEPPEPQFTEGMRVLLITAQEKARPLPDAPSGMVGLETSLALALTGLYHTGLLPLARVLALMSASPAALLGLPKGTLEVGRDADLVLFDPEEEWTIDKEQFVSKGRNTPFHGRTVRGRVKYTISQGKIIYMEG